MAQGFYDLIGSMFSAPDQWVSDGSYRTTSPSLPANVPTPMSVRGLNAVGDFIPGYGDVKAIGEAGQALSQGELLAAGLLGTGAAIGLVPGAGDALARPVIAAGRRVADAVPSEAIYAGRSLAEGDFGGVFDAFTPGRPAQSLSAMSLWHGSPYDFDKFDLANVGRGEGAQDLGRGFSLTDEQGEAILYSNPASRWGDLAAMEKYRQLGPGRYYKVDVNADPEQFLDWNAPWRSQVKDGTPLFDKMLEQERELMSIYGDDPAMVEAIPQAKLSRMWKDNAGFEDAAARSGFVGNRRRNYSGDTEYTVFDPENLSIAEKFDADGNIIGLLSDPAAQRGDEILNLLSTGRGNEVTDAMLDMGDNVQNARLNEYLFNNYDLPMDEASRMARADAGWPVGAYHGTRADFSEFDKGDVGYHLGTDEQAQQRLNQTRRDRGMEGEQVLPLRARADNPLISKDAGEWDDARAASRTLQDAGLLVGDIVDEATNLAPQFEDVDFWKWSGENEELLGALRYELNNSGYDSIKYANESENAYGDLPGLTREGKARSNALRKERSELRRAVASRRPPVPDNPDEIEGWINAPEPSPTAKEAQRLAEIDAELDRIHRVMVNDASSYIITAPTNIRSRFARFDPRLSHLRNLSAGLGGVGLLGLMDRENLDQETRNYLAGGA